MEERAHGGRRRLTRTWPPASTLQVAAAVAAAAHAAGVSSLPSPPAEWEEYIAARMWSPDGKTTRASGMPGQGVQGHPGDGHPAGGKAHPPRPHPHPSGLPAHP